MARSAALLGCKKHPTQPNAALLLLKEPPPDPPKHHAVTFASQRHGDLLIRHVSAAIARAHGAGDASEEAADSEPRA